MAKKMTEDQVRDKARDILGLTDKGLFIIGGVVGV